MVQHMLQYSMELRSVGTVSLEQPLPQTNGTHTHC